MPAPAGGHFVIPQRGTLAPWLIRRAIREKLRTDQPAIVSPPLTLSTCPVM